MIRRASELVKGPSRPASSVNARSSCLRYSRRRSASSALRPPFISAESNSPLLCGRSRRSHHLLDLVTREAEPSARVVLEEAVAEPQTSLVEPTGTAAGVAPDASRVDHHDRLLDPVEEERAKHALAEQRSVMVIGRRQRGHVADGEAGRVRRGAAG